MSVAPSVNSGSLQNEGIYVATKHFKYPAIQIKIPQLLAAQLIGGIDYKIMSAAADCSPLPMPILFTPSTAELLSQENPAKPYPHPVVHM